jgi:tRNA dimethylallyltransferase
MSNNSKNPNALPVIVIMGPTASGKTQFSFDLADALDKPCEIISVDSVLIYKNMDIGTAKPKKDELTRLPHHLIDIKAPTEAYSVAEFLSDADLLVKQIHQRGHIPLLVGGTLMYHTAFINGLASLPEANPEIRADIEQQAKQKGWDALHQQLMQIDAKSAAQIHPNDPVRITRALELYQLTDKPLSELQQTTTREHDYPLYIVNIMPKSRKILHERIQQRLDSMFADGFVDEVRAILALPNIDLDSPAMRSVGYRQVASYLNGEISLEEAKDKALFATRQFAKRQITWLRRYFPDVFTIYSDESEDLVADFQKHFPNML